MSVGSSKPYMPPKVPACTPRSDCGCGELKAVLNEWDGGYKRVFVELGLSGSCGAAVTSGMAAVMSICLQSGVPAPVLGKVLRRHTGSCHQATETHPTCIVTLGRLFSDHVGDVSDEELPCDLMKMHGTLRKCHTGCGWIEVSCFDDSEGTLRTVKAELADTNTCANTVTAALAKLLTLALSYGVDPQALADALKGIQCPTSVTDENGRKSCLHAIGNAMVAHETAKQEDLSEVAERMAVLASEAMEESGSM